jgi:redox-sensitive bicupin YhaK (pirin superfamily)
MKTFCCLLLLTTTVWADDSAKLATLLAQGGVVTIPAGDYHIDGTQALSLASNMTVFAHGARFILPETLPDKARVVLFAGEDIAHFTWHGGEFVGHVGAECEHKGHRDHDHEDRRHT